MPKKINAYIDAQNNKIVILSDDVQKDDYIDLNSLSSINEYIESSIENNQGLKDKYFNQFRNSDEYLKLKKESESLQVAYYQIDSLKKEIIQNETNIINKFKLGPEYNELKNENQKLYQSNLLLNEQIKNIRENAINEFKASDEHKKLITELTTLKIQNQHFIDDIPNIQNKAINDYKNSAEHLKMQLDLEKYKQQIDIRNSMNIKKIGEDLEKYCFDMYQETMGQYVNDCLFEKTNNPISGSKPDFLFEVYGIDENNNINFDKDYLLGRVVLEMKSELSNSEEKNKKTNANHLAELEKDRINFGAELGILVSELESDKDFVIQKSTDYQNLIIIRPQVLPSLLNIIRNLFHMKNQFILEQINFKSSKEILDDFHEFKKSILDNCIEHIKKKMDVIIKNANNIKQSADKILEASEHVLYTYVDRIINKIDDFKIENKVLKKINKLSQSALSDKSMVSNSTYLDESNIIKEKIK